MTAPTAPVPSHRLLIVDDTPSIHDDFRKIFAPQATNALDELEQKFFGSPTTAVPKRYRFDLTHANQGEEAHELNLAAVASDRPFAVAFVDMRMPPGWDGLETIRHLWAGDPRLQIVICTAYSDHSWTSITAQLGLSDNLVVLRKPFDNIEVLQLAHAFAAKWSLARQLQAQLRELDLTARLNAAAFQTANTRFSAAFLASSTAYVIVTLPENNILLANPAFLRLTQWPTAPLANQSLVSLPCWPVPNSLPRCLASIAAGETLPDSTLTLPMPDDHPRTLRLTGSAFVDEGQPCALLQFSDVTEQVRLQQQLFHAQKMEAVGALSAGIAHDFNNLLTVIQGYTSAVLQSPALPAEARAELLPVAAAAERAAALTRQLLLFSRRQISQPEPIDLGRTLTGLQKMLTRLFPERIALIVPSPSHLPRVHADPSNIEQVIMNLVINAADAIPGAGTIEITLHTVELGAAAPARHADARPGSFVCLGVRDTGTGMTPEVLQHIYDPFFTTKDVGKGTGLGLSTVYGIVRQHQGWIEVDSTPGQGTTFRVFLPAMSEKQESPAPSPIFDPGAATDLGRGERILLVEDDLAVRMVANVILTRAGYVVLEAGDAETALRVWRENDRKFDLVLTDVVMPNGINGIELASRLRQERPDIRLVFSTGYSKDLLRGVPPSLGEVPVLLKPYTRGTILSTVRSVFDHRSPATTKSG